jgi:DNA-binding FadR family transcriptional regulator
VASAIQRGEAHAAHAAMSRIVEQSTEEMGTIWSRHQQSAPNPKPASGAVAAARA